MSLFSLPSELVMAIAEEVHPSTIVEFAQASHQTYACAEAPLARHRERSRKFRVFHDRHPMGILNMLRTAQADPDATWYVRTMEFYGYRADWKDWKTYYDYKYMRDEPLIESTLGTPSLLQEQDDHLPDVFSKVSRVSSLWEHLKGFHHGDDQPLKAMLIAMCPRLERVTWVAQTPGGMHDTQPFSLLCDLIDVYQPLSSCSWPPGFSSLRTISLGACTEHVHPHDNLHPDLQDFCKLLLLPSLKELRINVAGYGDQDLEYLYKHVPARSSSVEVMTIHICDFDEQVIVALLGRLRLLRSYTVIYLGSWTSNLLNRIQPMFGASLETLRLGGSNDMKQSLYENIGDLAGFPKLKDFDIKLGDLIVGQKRTDSSMRDIDATKVEWLDFDAVLPLHAESINFRYLAPHDSYPLEGVIDKVLIQGFCNELDKFVKKRAVAVGGQLIKVGLVTANWQTADLEAVVKDWESAWRSIGVELLTDRKAIDWFDEETLEAAPTALELDDNGEPI